MMRFLVLILAFMSTFNVSAKTGHDVFRTLSCAFEDNAFNHKFQIEVDMVNSATFFPKATYFGDDVHIYQLTQKHPQRNERYRFILNESDPDDALLVQVYEDKKAEVTFLRLQSPFNFVKGTCFYY